MNKTEFVAYFPNYLDHDRSKQSSKTPKLFIEALQDSVLANISKRIIILNQTSKDHFKNRRSNYHNPTFTLNFIHHFKKHLR